MHALATVVWIGLSSLSATAAEPWGTPVMVAGPERVIVTADGVEELGRGYLGVDLIDLSPELRVHYGAPDAAGLLVARVEPKGPADKGGLRVGDVLVAVDATELGSTWDMVSAIRPRTPGEPVSLSVMRGKKSVTLSVELGERHQETIWVGEAHEGVLELGDDVRVVVRDALGRVFSTVGDQNFPVVDEASDDEIARFERKMILLETRIRELEAELARSRK